MGYQQLTQEERYYIWALKKSRKTKAQIAREMGRHPGAIGREYKPTAGQTAISQGKHSTGRVIADGERLEDIFALRNEFCGVERNIRSR